MAGGDTAGGDTTPVELDPAVRAFLDRVGHRVRRRDADTLLALMETATGERAAMWGPSIVGFGSYHYRYASGREGDAPAAGFAPRKAASVIYLSDGVGAHPDLVERLGPHTAGVGCLYLKDLADIDLRVLTELVARSYAALTAGTYGPRAREDGAGT
ncbi:DUF1801 domain-containing protein [Rhodococcus kronopolitis]|uniref:DUF1801 domain-containing protein n=1 Tax=Rhodococcus kronopolitis TaxID=1460226 RepID=A0ABV9FM43_9NOCA